MDESTALSYLNIEFSHVLCHGVTPLCRLPSKLIMLIGQLEDLSLNV